MSWQVEKQNMAFEEEKAMHNQEQDLKEYYRIIFTLKNGRQIEILTKEAFVESEVDYENNIIIEGFVATPMIIEKTISVCRIEIAAIEITKEPHITWKNTELDSELEGSK